jgi:hypothetical protein
VRWFTVVSGGSPTKRSVRIYPATHRGYQNLKSRVDSAAGRLRHALERPRSSEVRRAYVELDQAIGRALEFVEDRVRLPYRALRPPPAVPLDPFAAEAWHRELEALRDAREHVRFGALDDPHYGIPVVRVSTRAATRPDLAGLRTGEHDATAPSGNGMGVDIEAVVDEMSDHSRSGRRAVGDHAPGLGKAVSGQPRTRAPSTAA